MKQQRPQDSGRERPDEERGPGPERNPAPIGKGGTANVAGSDEQQPEIAEGPVPGMQPGDAEGEPGAVRRWQHQDGPHQGGPGSSSADSGERLEQAHLPAPPRHDPGAEPEDEGIPDLQDGSPERERWEEPQRQAVPGDTPVAAGSFGTTGGEQAEGESLDHRLTQEEPEVDEETAVAGVPEEAAGRLTLTDPHTDVSGEAPGKEAGMSAEEEAVRVRPENETDTARPGE